MEAGFAVDFMQRITHRLTWVLPRLQIYKNQLVIGHHTKLVKDEIARLHGNVSTLSALVRQVNEGLREVSDHLLLFTLHSHWEAYPVRFRGQSLKQSFVPSHSLNAVEVLVWGSAAWCLPRRWSFSTGQPCEEQRPTVGPGLGWIAG
eukprot:366203-Chlamydomonas_euryale.AAC.12